MVKITLPNGLILEGTVEQLNEASKKMGFGGVDEKVFYFSNSKGRYIRITEMDTKHIANVLFKKWNSFFLEPKTGTEFAERLCAPQFFALLKEYEKRQDR